ncbi:MAG: tRNA pseudouridine(38-40) synthase TruA [Clostridia bacterium]|nr:tRNA pseudouridine(38-40) synthase TruA [Clostridia bacterium]
MNLKLTLKYDGTEYHGWQRQPNGITIQEVLEDTLERVMKKKIVVTGCSRTDAGVHAAMHVSNFSADTSIPVHKIPLVLNQFLPKDIRAVKCEEVEESFNARYHTVEKTYRYRILNCEHSDPFLGRYVWHYPTKLDVSKMKQAASYMTGERDFTAFMASGSSAKTTVRNLKRVEVEKVGDVITVTATANGFLYNMVRIIVGTLVYVGNGKLSAEEVKKILEEKDRRLGGVTAPPEGLILEEVVY